jgi:hypothetical protein
VSLQLPKLDRDVIHTKSQPRRSADHTGGRNGVAVDTRCGGRESSDIGTRSGYVARMAFDVDAAAYDAFMGRYSVLLGRSPVLLG